MYVAYFCISGYVNKRKAPSFLSSHIYTCMHCNNYFNNSDIFAGEDVIVIDMINIQRVDKIFKKKSSFSNLLEINNFLMIMTCKQNESKVKKKNFSLFLFFPSSGNTSINFKTHTLYSFVVHVFLTVKQKLNNTGHENQPNMNTF